MEPCPTWQSHRCGGVRHPGAGPGWHGPNLGLGSPATLGSSWSVGSWQRSSAHKRLHSLHNTLQDGSLRAEIGHRGNGTRCHTSTPRRLPVGVLHGRHPRLAPWACVIYELNPHTSKPLVQTPCPTGSNSGPEGTQETPPSKHAMYFKKQRHRIILTVAQNRQSVSEGSARC